ncbi:MAG: hypothetical protein KDK37_07740 [Leptospiraceae bacterium]|nr:hypothetical protein [Leptospiraceae bacterium]MCB1304152.1 hypothetical protein [Leptospiraceae bacterium]
MSTIEDERILLHNRLLEFISFLNRRGESNRQISLRIGRADRYIDNCIQKRTDVSTATLQKLHKTYGLNFIWYFTGCGPRRVNDALIRIFQNRKSR